MELFTLDKIKKHEIFFFFFLSPQSFFLWSSITPLSPTPPTPSSLHNPLPLSKGPLSLSLPNGGRQSFLLFDHRTSSNITRFVIENKEIDKISYLRLKMKQPLDLKMNPTQVVWIRYQGHREQMVPLQ